MRTSKNTIGKEEEKEEDTLNVNVNKKKKKKIIKRKKTEIKKKGTTTKEVISNAINTLPNSNVLIIDPKQVPVTGIIKPISICKRKSVKIIFIIGIIVLFIGVGIFLLWYFKFRPKHETKEQEEESGFIIVEDIKDAFKSDFNISSKENTLIQLSLKSTKKFDTLNNGSLTSDSTSIEAIYDIFTLNGTESKNTEKEIYSMKYITAITLNSFCSKTSLNSLDEKCDLQKMLDLNFKNNNLRRISEEDKELVKKAILPICIVEHTDTNIILSIKCPETLSKNFKNDIILAFQSIKPASFKGLNNDEEIAKTNVEEKDDKIYINSYAKDCKDTLSDPKKEMNCNEIRNIITDKEGNLVSSEKVTSTDIITDEANKFSKTFTYLFKDISNGGANNFDSENYKSNLNIIFDLVESLMKDEYSTTIKDIVERLNNTNEDEENIIETRNLQEEKIENNGINE